MKRLFGGVLLLCGCLGENIASHGEGDQPGTSAEVVTRKTASGPITYLVRNGENEKIIDTDEKVVVNATGSNIPERYRQLLNAFGKISMGCTATHVGQGLVLSAGHCFRAPSTPVFDRPCSDTVEWGYRTGAPISLTSTCTRMGA